MCMYGVEGEKVVQWTRRHRREESPIGLGPGGDANKVDLQHRADGGSQT